MTFGLPAWDEATVALCVFFYLGQHNIRCTYMYLITMTFQKVHNYGPSERSYLMLIGPLIGLMMIGLIGQLEVHYFTCK